MGHVNQHTDPVHFGNQAVPKAAETVVLQLVATAAHQVLLVVGHQHVADAEFVVKRHEIEIAPDRTGALEMEADSQLAPVARTFDIGGGLGQHEVVRAGLDGAAFPGDQAHGFSHIGIIDSHGQTDEVEAGSGKAIRRGRFLVKAGSRDVDRGQGHVADHSLTQQLPRRLPSRTLCHLPRLPLFYLLED